MSTVIYWIIVGLIAGVIARLIVPGREPIGFILTILVGIVGAIIGGYILEALNVGSPTFGWRIVEGIIGAAILLAIYHLVERRSL
jgi:uncharacterized membrane protein YeaQ/YmgE (transglycosylase-associated protein family)